MAIYKGSRYQFAALEFLSKSAKDDAIPTLFYTFDELGIVNYQEYTWKSGDRLDNLATTFYNSPDKWWLLAEYNPEITDLGSIAPGTKIRIPRV